MALVLFLRARVLALAMELNVAIIFFNIADALFFIFGLLTQEGYIIVKMREGEREGYCTEFVRWRSKSKSKRSGIGMKDYEVGAVAFIE
jgi:hypothetical protein